jgi:hypothetical protein
MIPAPPKIPHEKDRSINVVDSIGVTCYRLVKNVVDPNSSKNSEILDLIKDS